jgi:hypothetical protein
MRWRFWGVLSRSGLREVRHLEKAVAVAGFLPKPISLESLSSRLREVLAGSTPRSY